MIRLDNSVTLTNELILKIVKKHKEEELPRLLKLAKYYDAKNIVILSRPQVEQQRPNNKIANPYASYITDTLTGYFLGKPITYNCDQAILDKLNAIFDYTDEADNNVELAKEASIFGVAYELVYCDEEGQIKLANLQTPECIPVYDTTIDKKLLYFIRYYENYDFVKDVKYITIEVIDDKGTTVFKTDEIMSNLQLVDQYEHLFGMVPVAVYQNNEDEVGDFEKVITLIDAYDKMESDTLNDQEYFTDAYLALYGYNADSEDVEKMRKDKVLLMDQGTKAEWLIKTGNDRSSENLKDRLDNDIHKFAKCPNMSDENFASNASGIAIKFKTLGTENIVSIKERKFKKGIQQRLKLINQIDNLLEGEAKWGDIEIVFTRNLPANETELATMVATLSDIVSDETLLAQIPFVEDVQAELERLEEQKEKAKENNPFFTAVDYQTKAMNKEEEEDEQV